MSTDSIAAASFWKQLSIPIIGLSPMDGVTDHPFRHIQKKYGQPAVMYTEFTNVEGVCHGATRLLRDFLFDETQRPIVAQIYGTTPDYFRQTTIALCLLGFDGIDINMGCPAKNVAHSGAGAALIKNPELAVRIIKAVQQGVREYRDGITLSECPDISPSIAQEVQERQSHLPHAYLDRTRTIPVSVKTRIGYDAPVIDQWIPTLLECQIDALALHGRTLKQQYSGLASWQQIARAAELVKQTTTTILGNGDIKSYEDAIKLIQDSGVDGVLIGRGSMGNPFIFQPTRPIDPIVRATLAYEHSLLFEQTYQALDGERYAFLPMRKHLGWYISDMPQASSIRKELFTATSAQQVKEILSTWNLLTPSTSAD